MHVQRSCELCVIHLISILTAVAHLTTLEDLYARPGFLLRRAHQIAVGIFVEECGPYRLTPPQHSTLIVIGHCPGIDQAALARAIGFDRATIGGVVEGLEARGLLKRQTSRADKRRKLLVLTPQGRALMRRAAPAIRRTSERLLAPLQPDERRLFVRFLLQLAQDLNESSRSPVTAPVEGAASEGQAA
jgi:MarR family transcriptional regulator, lower aerobic nicotinate degradation pathway regulator